MIKQSFTVSPGGTLCIEMDGDLIRVEPSSKSVVKNHSPAENPRQQQSGAGGGGASSKLELTFEVQGAEVPATAKYNAPRWP